MDKVNNMTAEQYAHTQREARERDQETDMTTTAEIKSRVSPLKFIKFVELMGGNPDVAVSCLRSRAWPDFKEVAKAANFMASNLEPCDKNLQRHARLTLLAQWAERRTS